MCNCNIYGNQRNLCFRCKQKYVGQKEIDLTLTDSKDILYNSIELMVGSLKGICKSIHIFYRKIINRPLKHKVWNYE